MEVEKHSSPTIATIRNDWKSSPINKVNGNSHESPVTKDIPSNVYKNGENGETPTWLPLLTKESHDCPGNEEHNANNNKWTLNAARNISDIKYRWEELPQDENHQNPPAISRGGANNGTHDKNEQEALTGVIHQPDDDDDDDLSNCGIGPCQPKWARYFASTHVFMVIFLFAWVLQVRKPQIHIYIYISLSQKVSWFLYEILDYSLRTYIQILDDCHQ